MLQTGKCTFKPVALFGNGKHCPQVDVRGGRLASFASAWWIMLDNVSHCCPENVPVQSSPPRPPSASSLDSPGQVCSPNCNLDKTKRETAPRLSTHHLSLLVQLSLPFPALIVAGGGQDMEEEEQKVQSARQHLANWIRLHPDLPCSPPPTLDTWSFPSAFLVCTSWMQNQPFPSR